VTAGSFERIPAQLQAGMTVDEIVAGFVEEYGLKAA
jgi:hypothetical protein